MGAAIAASWLGRVEYRAAWDLQRRLVDRRATEVRSAADDAGAPAAEGDALLLLEHPAVLTLGRHADASHVLAGPDLLRARGIEVIRVERGGEVTYHGPGQLVGYPIVALAARGLLVRPFVRALEGALVDACAAFGVAADRRDGHPGCWVDADGPFPRKIGALGVRIERGVSYHGVALNVAPDLADFELIDPCGMPGVASTSIARELARAGRPFDPDGAVRRAADAFAASFATRIGAELAWVPASVVETRAEGGPAAAAARIAVPAGGGA
jgi:lipoyl(octanoyl) transferase